MPCDQLALAHIVAGALVGTLVMACLYMGSKMGKP
jgi:hypothetical protein